MLEHWMTYNTNSGLQIGIQVDTIKDDLVFVVFEGDFI